MVSGRNESGCVGGYFSVVCDACWNVSCSHTNNNDCWGRWKFKANKLFNVSFLLQKKRTNTTNKCGIIIISYLYYLFVRCALHTKLDYFVKDITNEVYKDTLNDVYGLSIYSYTKMV